MGQEQALNQARLPTGSRVKAKDGSTGYLVAYRKDGTAIIEREGGWRRDHDIPNDYKSRLTDEYWFVTDVELLDDDPNNT